MPLAAVLGVGARSHAATGDLAAAATSDHLWFVQPAEVAKAGFELCHHSPKLEGPFYRVQALIAQPPVAMAAVADRVWLVFPPKDDAGNSGREVYTVQAQFNPAFASFYIVPSGRMEPVAPLPGVGRLASFIGSSDGPAALLWPSPRSRPGKDSPETEQPRILRLSGNQWIEVPLPPEVDPNRPSLLAAAGPEGSSLVLLTAAPGGARQVLRHDLSVAGEWLASTLDLDLRRIVSLARQDSQLVAALDEPSTDALWIAYLRASAFLPVATVPKPRNEFWLLPLGGELAILQAIGPRNFSLTQVHPSDGGSGESQQLVPQPMSATRVWQVGLVLAVVVMSILLLFVVKPLIAPETPLPRGVVLLSGGRRLMAILIDLIPGAVIALVLLRCSPVDLLQAPVMTFDANALAPNILMMAITAVYCAVFELIWCATPGKWLVGGMIESRQQGRPSATKVLARNVVKFLVLLVPPLGLVVLLNPHMQGLQDVAGRTLVVRKGESLAESEPPDAVP